MTIKKQAKVAKELSKQVATMTKIAVESYMLGYNDGRNCRFD